MRIASRRSDRPSRFAIDRIVSPGLAMTVRRAAPSGIRSTCPTLSAFILVSWFVAARTSSGIPSSAAIDAKVSPGRTTYLSPEACAAARPCGKGARRATNSRQASSRREVPLLRRDEPLESGLSVIGKVCWTSLARDLIQKTFCSRTFTRKAFGSAAGAVPNSLLSRPGQPLLSDLLRTPNPDRAHTPRA